MPNPTRSDVHVNRPLSNMSLAFIQGAEDFVADRIFPNISVPNKSDSFFTYDRGDWNRDEMRTRAPSTESAGGGWNIGTDTYKAEVYAFHKDIDDQIRANQDAPLNLDREATEYCTLKALIKRETLFASTYFTSGVWTTNVTGTAATPATGEALQWNDSASTPINDVDDAIDTVKESTGFKPNTLVLGYKVWKKLKNHPDIVDRIKYSGGVSPSTPAIVSRQAVAQLFEVDRILVMGGIQNTADEGATNVHSYIGGKHALLVYVPPRPGIMTPAAGYTFSWTGYVGASNMGSRIMRFRMDHLKSDRVEIEMAFDQKLVSADLGYFFNGIVA